MRQRPGESLVAGKQPIRRGSASPQTLNHPEALPALVKPPGARTLAPFSPEGAQG